MSRVHPIIFDGESVRAILEGRKTQTRRVVRVAQAPPVRAPWSPGDRLWVREAWRHVASGDDTRWEYRAGGWMQASMTDAPGLTDRDAEAEYEGSGRAPQWRSPIYMPRAASRLTLVVKRVRVERAQEIRMADAVAEGYPFVGKRDPEYDSARAGVGDGSAAVQWFARRWDDINAKRGSPWESNPWVWVCEFGVEEALA